MCNDNITSKPYTTSGFLLPKDISLPEQWDVGEQYCPYATVMLRKLKVEGDEYKKSPQYIRDILYLWGQTNKTLSIMIANVKKYEMSVFTQLLLDIEDYAFSDNPSSSIIATRPITAMSNRDPISRFAKTSRQQLKLNKKLDINSKSKPDLLERWLSRASDNLDEIAYPLIWIYKDQ